MSDDIDAAVDNYFSAREAIFKHFGYVEGWRDLPIEDSRDQFWAVDEHEDQWVKFSPNREALVYWLAEHDDEYGPYGNELYENEIYTQRHLKKWVLRGPELTMVVVDTNTDGNKFLQLFRNENEIRSSDVLPEPESEPEPEPEPESEPKLALPNFALQGLFVFADTVDRMILAGQTVGIDEMIEKFRMLCAGLPFASLQAALVSHRSSCRQPSCPILAVMEQLIAKEMQKANAAKMYQPLKPLNIFRPGRRRE